MGAISQRRGRPTKHRNWTHQNCKKKAERARINHEGVEEPRGLEIAKNRRVIDGIKILTLDTAKARQSK
jgi:hypothetical protein